jgi:hypothetical protein
MTWVGCPACRTRFAPFAAAHAACPRCGGALTALAPHEALGYALAASPELEWRPAEVDALARAVAIVTASAHLP